MLDAQGELTLGTGQHLEPTLSLVSRIIRLP